jgi:hypothetical protein
VRLRLANQQLTRLIDDGTDLVAEPWRAGRRRRQTLIAPRRAIDERGQTILAVPLPGMTGVHWLEPGPSGTPLAVATAFGPTRVMAKPYQFVEFNLLQTAHGLAVAPRADDLVVRAGPTRFRSAAPVA